MHTFEFARRGLRAGTKEELLANLRWIKSNTGRGDAVGDQTRRQSVLPFEDFDYPVVRPSKAESKEASPEEVRLDAKADAKW